MLEYELVDANRVCPGIYIYKIRVGPVTRSAVATCDNTKESLKISKTVNVQAFVTMYHSPSIVSWPTVCLVAQNSIAKVPNQESRQIVNSFFLLASSSDGLVQNCTTLSQCFSHKTAAFYTEQCTSPSLVHNFEVSRGSSNQSLKIYGGFICKTVFFTCSMHTKALCNKM